MEIQMYYPEGPGNAVRERTPANAPMVQCSVNYLAESAQPLTNSNIQSESNIDRTIGYRISAELTGK